MSCGTPMLRSGRSSSFHFRCFRLVVGEVVVVVVMVVVWGVSV